MFRLKLISGLLLAVSSFVAAAEPINTVEYKYYLISPQSPQQIKTELLRHTPIRTRHGLFHGHTDWYIEWQYQTTNDAYGCQLYDIKINAHVTHTLPALSKKVTDEKTIAAFNKFISALTQHEKNHGSNALSAAKELEKALSQIQPQHNCRYLAQMIAYIGRSTAQKYSRKDFEYDRSTNNGMTEGALVY